VTKVFLPGLAYRDHHESEEMSVVDVKEKEDTGKPDTAKPYPPRWVWIYMVVLLLGLLVWGILCVLHGGPPWTHPW
jgi:hypothetical protein